MNEHALDLRGLGVRHSSCAVLLDGISLTVRRGEALVVIGETGSGKSLVAQALLGLLPAEFSVAGTVAVGEGEPIRIADGPALRRLWAERLMLMPQEPGNALDPTMRIGRQIADAAKGRAFSLAEALRSVDLPPEAAAAYPFALSGGMAQRALVATTLAGRAPLLVVDEPTKGLDPERSGQTLALLRGALARGRSLLVITHDLRLAQGLGGDVAVMRAGRLVEFGPMREVFRAPKSAYTRDWLAADPATWPGTGPATGEASRRRPPAEPPVVAVRDLAFGYPGRPMLFQGMSFEIRRGGIVALTGPSGAGKTTLGNLLLGLQPPLAGEVSWAGIDPYRDRQARKRLRRRYQKLHQDPAAAFDPDRPVGRQLAELQEVKPDLARAEALPRLLERLKVRKSVLDRCPGEVSGGEAQRLALARLLLLDPDLIVADEPTSRLDPIVQRRTIELLLEIVEERGLALALISHDRHLVRSIADQVIAIERNPAAPSDRVSLP